MLIRILITTFLHVALCTLLSSQIATGLPGCLTITDQVGVVCGGGTSSFGLNGSGQFEFQNIDGEFCCPGGSGGGGDFNAYFEMEEIDISCFEDVFISMSYMGEISGGGSFEDDSPSAPVFGCQTGANDFINNSHDQIVFVYILDGGGETQSLYVHGTTEADFTGTWMEGPLNGNTLSIKVYASNKAGHEIFRFDNLEVTGTDVPLTAGPDDDICNETTYDLQGTGCGTWTGGNGFYSDINDPTATYTFDASEIGSPVTLTFSSSPPTPGCAGGANTDDVTLTPSEVTADPVTITECASNLTNYDLTTENTNVNATETVTWYDGQPSAGGTEINPATNADISGGIDLWAQVEDGNGCTNEVQITVNETPGPTAELSGFADLCPGDCESIIVDITGGTGPYLIDVSLDGFPAVSIPGFDVSDMITICFDNGGSIFDPSTITFDVPEVTTIDFSLDIMLNGIVDNNGCLGSIVGGPVAISFNQAPDILTIPPVEECDDGTGQATFDLDALTPDINGGSGDIVIYYSDAGALNPIGPTYTTGTTTIFAQVSGNTCDSELIPVDLVVVNNGDAGTVTINCAESGTDMCTICDTGGPGADVTLFIDFTSTQITSFTIQLTNTSGSTTQTISTIASDNLYTFNILENTTFDITLIELMGSCPDAMDLGGVVTIELITQPEFEDPGQLSGCGQVTLPAVTVIQGTAPFYYDNPAGTGTPIAPGTVIATSQTLHLYSGVPGCEQTIPVAIIIEPLATLDPITDVEACGSYVLPEILGTNITTSAYWTLSGGMGLDLMPGEVITTSMTLFAFAQCGDVEEEFDIVITAGPTITNTDTTVCQFYVVEPIMGMNLSNTEDYYESAAGLGQNINVGDTIRTDSTIYIFDSSPGCVQDIPINITVVQPKNAGRDTLINICVGTTTVYDVYEDLLGDDADTLGQWILLNTNDTLGIVESFNFTDSLAGTYNYTYSFEDSVCIEDIAIISINILNDTGGTGQDMDITLCNTDQSAYNIAISSYPPGSNWQQILNGDTIAFNISNYVLADQPENIDSFLNTAPGGNCGDIVSLLTLDIEVPVSAGDDNSRFVCGNANINLTTLLENNDAIGIFIESSPSGGLLGSSFTTAGLSEDTYIINHVVVSNNNCENDTAVLQITLSSGPSAGSDVVTETCDRDIDINNYLPSDADPGGDFFLGATPIPNGLTTLAPGQTRTFRYMVGGTMGCPSDISEIEISFADVPEANFLIPLNFCYEDCRNFRIVIEDIDTLYLTITDGTDSFPLVVPVPPSDTVSIPLCNMDDGIFDGTNLEPEQTYNIIIDSLFSMLESCTFPSDLVSSDINTRVYEGTYVETFCNDTTIVIGDMTFDISNPIGMATIDGGGQFGCDSIVNVSLTFDDTNFGMAPFSACAGQPFTDPIFGIEWTEANNQGDVSLMGSNGCDSIVTVTVTFSDEVITPFPISFCSGQSDTVLGEVFDENRLTDTISTGITTAAGCDSLVAVTVTITDSDFTSLVGDVCVEYAELVGAGFFNIDNQGDTIQVGMSSTGCDSLVINNYDYVLLPDTTYIDTTVCDENFFIQIGQLVYDQDQPSGFIDFPLPTVNGCDSVISVNIVYIDFSAEVDFADATCANSGFGTMTINSVTGGQTPYSIVTDTGMISIGTLPFVQEVAVGSGMISIAYPGSECAIPISYTINPATTNSFSAVLNNGNIFIPNSTTPIDSIMWSPPEGLACSTCESTAANPTDTTTYTATIYYGGGCVDTASVTVFVADEPDPEPEDVEGEYFIPNVFNPDGNFGNRIFKVIPSTTSTGQVSSMQIYDRWGSLMFSNNDAAFLMNGGGWDGTKAGTKLSPGVYVYKIVIVEADGSVINELGDVTLIY